MSEATDNWCECGHRRGDHADILQHLEQDFQDTHCFLCNCENYERQVIGLPNPDVDEAEEAGYSLVMPFVITKTNGGPFEDDSFVAGVNFAYLDRDIKYAAMLNLVPQDQYVDKRLTPQIDLLAMKGSIRVRFVAYDDFYVLAQFDTEDGTRW